MKKRLIMSASILAALGGNASASMGDTVAKAMDLRLETIECKDNQRHVSAESLEMAMSIIAKLNTQTKQLREVYSEIEQSEVPESYFDKVTIDELVVADGYIRGFEMILKAQHESLSRRVMASEQPAVETAKQIRKATAKLRRVVGDLMSIERQLQVASIGKYETSFEMTSDKVAKLKAATQATVSNYH